MIQELMDPCQRNMEYEQTIMWLRKKGKERAEEPHLGVPCRQTLAHPREPIHIDQLEKKYMKKAPAENPTPVVKGDTALQFPSSRHVELPREIV